MSDSYAMRVDEPKSSRSTKSSLPGLKIFFFFDQTLGQKLQGRGEAAQVIPPPSFIPESHFTGQNMGPVGFQQDAVTRRRHNHK